MPKIKSSADLRNNYNEISTFCHNYPEPVFITKNGKGDLAVMSIEAYEDLTSRFELYSQIKEGMDDVASDNTQPFSKAMADIRSCRTRWVIASYHIHRRAWYYAYCGLHRIYTQNPQAADNLLDAVTKQIGTLSDFPQKFRLVDDPVLASWEIRFVIINNYLAFYTINEEKQSVIVVRFLYKKSNWCSILRQGFSLV